MTGIFASSGRDDHPSSEDLLLLESGELEAPAEIQDHVRNCAECARRLRAHTATLGAVAAATRGFQPGAMGGRWRLLRDALAAAAAIAVLFYVTAQRPSARLDAFLAKGVGQQATANSRRPQFLRLRSRSASCYPNLRLAYAPDDCRALNARFRDAGWEWNEALSIRAYHRWRASLRDKTDAFRWDDGVAVVSTSTAEGALLRATLWVRSSDYSVTSGQFQFRDSTPVEVTEVDASEMPAPLVAEPPPVGAPVRPHPEATVAPDLIEPHLDEVEARARIVLRALDADAGFETSVEREASEVVVRGVARTLERWESIEAGLRDIARVRTEVTTAERLVRTDAPAPWMPQFHYTESPLAVKLLRQVFPDPAVEQEFSDATLQLARDLASYAEARDGLARLLDGGNTGSQTALARAALAELDAAIEAVLKQIDGRLAPLVRPTAAPRTSLDAAEAIELYRSVYSLIYLSGPDSGDLAGAIERIRTLLAGPAPAP